LARLSRDLLDLAKIQEGRTVLKIEPVNLEEIANDVRDSMKMVKGSVTIDIAFDPGAKKVVSDPDKIKQVFTNLAINAFQAMPQGGELLISGRVENDGGPEPWAYIEFKDTGTGILEENIKKIFEPLFTTKAKGTGLMIAGGTMLGLGIAGIITTYFQPHCQLLHLFHLYQSDPGNRLKQVFH
jgi:signal transduction histidine kinase